VEERPNVEYTSKYQKLRLEGFIVFKSPEQLLGFISFWQT